MTAIFDRLFDEGSRAVLSGEHTTDQPPREPGERWGPSVCLRPCPDGRATLSSLADEAAALAGSGHWRTGSAGSSHFTVRVLDRYREELDPDGGAVERYVTATRRAWEVSGPVRLRLTGLTLTPASVMACAEPVGPSAGVFAKALADELGAHGHYEQAFDRSIWYANVVHFTGPIAAPRRLVDWVGARRRTVFGEVETRAEVLAWRFDERQMVPVVLG